MGRIPEPFSENNSSPETPSSSALPIFAPQDNEVIVEDDAYNSGHWNNVYGWQVTKKAGENMAILAIIQDAAFSTGSGFSINIFEYCKGILVKSGSILFSTVTSAKAGAAYLLNELTEMALITAIADSTFTAGNLTMYKKKY